MNAFVRHPVVARLCVALALALLLLLSAQPASAQSTGQWQNGPNFPFFPVHMHVLPTGNVMMWPGDGGVSGDDPRVWNVSTGTVNTTSRAGFDLFCSGHNYLPDGRLFVAGGHISNNVGLPDATIFNPANNTWTRQPQMNLGRWYPTTTMLPNGDVLVVTGDVDMSQGANPLPQVWQAATGTWRSLTNAVLYQPWYPYMFLAPNGQVFDAGPTVATRYLNTAGTGAWSLVANRTYNGVRDFGGAVMYEPGKILVAGGDDPPTNTAEVIDLNATTPVWRAVGSMGAARRQMSTTMLPDGKVLVTGGTKGTGFNNLEPANHVLTAELWDPATERFTPMASGTNPRLYHSIAVLLPDARVLVTGGNGYTQSEIFSPPYLFAGARPTISDAPASVGKGQTFRVVTPQAADINAVSWVRLPSVTHTNDMNQAFFRSTTITRNTGSIDITAPNTTTVAPGHYMLFLLQNGVPSLAKIVQLTPTINNPSPTISSIAPSSAAAQSASFTLTVNGTGFVSGSKVRWNGADRTTTFVSNTQLTAAIPATDVASAGTAQVTVFNPSPGGGLSTALTFTITTSAPPNPAPTISSIAPSSAAAQSASFTLTVNGTGFVSGSKVRWNGADRTTTFVSNTQLTAAIPATDVASAGTAQVTVFSPSPGGGTSTAVTFTVTASTSSNPVPTVASTAPTSTVAGGAGFTLTVNGTGFMSGSKVRWNNVDRPTTVVSATQVTAAIPASDIANAGTAQVTVFNPTPGGGASPALAFTINPSQNLSSAGTIIARVTAPTGGGAKNIEIIRDGVTPPVGSTAEWLQYDTYDGPNTATEDWIGYQYSSSQTFNRVVFQEGRHFSDGGWFENLTVQVRQGGNWVNVSNLTISPAYPGINDGETFETYTLQFTAIIGDAIRIHGAPGGSADFISVGELQVFGP